MDKGENLSQTVRALSSNFGRFDATITHDLIYNLEPVSDTLRIRRASKKDDVKLVDQRFRIFESDNFVSNEEEYLRVLDKMKKLGASGGAYIGVGPEQNLTYIAAIRQPGKLYTLRSSVLGKHEKYRAFFFKTNMTRQAAKASL